MEKRVLIKSAKTKTKKDGSELKGVKNGKPWEIVSVQLGDGKYADTFDTTFKGLVGQEVLVKITEEESNGYKNTAIDLVKEESPQPQTVNTINQVTPTEGLEAQTARAHALRAAVATVQDAGLNSNDTEINQKIEAYTNKYLFYIQTGNWNY